MFDIYEKIMWTALAVSMVAAAIAMVVIAVGIVTTVI